MLPPLEIGFSICTLNVTPQANLGSIETRIWMFTPVPNIRIEFLSFQFFRNLFDDETVALICDWGVPFRALSAHLNVLQPFKSITSRPRRSHDTELLAAFEVNGRYPLRKHILR
jgi:hypothetical protein